MAAPVAQMQQQQQVEAAPAPFVKLARHRCVRCGKPARSSCGRCRSERYCSRDCQAQMWMTHREVCSTLAEERLVAAAASSSSDDGQGEALLVNVTNMFTGASICSFPDARARWTVHDLYSAVASAIDTPVAELRLVHKGQKVDLQRKRVHLGSFLDAEEEKPTGLTFSLLRCSPERAAMLQQAANGVPLEELCEELPCDDRELLVAACEASGVGLEQAAEEFRNDAELVLMAIEKHGSALAHAGDALLFNEEFILSAISQNSNCLRYAPESLQRNRDFLLKAVEKNGSALYSFPDELQEDEDFIFEAVAKNSRAYRYACSSVLASERIALFVAKHQSAEFHYVHESLRNNEAFMLRAVTANPEVLRHVDSPLILDLGFLLKCIKKAPASLQHLVEELRTDLNFVRQCLLTNPKCIFFVHESLQSSAELMSAFKQAVEARNRKAAAAAEGGEKLQVACKQRLVPHRFVTCRRVAPCAVMPAM
eukprot:TRINITY_DN27923_c0_g1_i1.p1 TRINITY_DN27923_c0_g1~~TRINITY_DN27923_c0_g1_i1.p1  ORF type:complete len:482 (+),score=183.72 TRINITY_DN27923_c0_g1_i1:102-1547(+)